MKLLVSLLAASQATAQDRDPVTCDAGYELEPVNKTECLDVNECNNGGCLGPAANFCQNLDGSFECGCSDGYSLGDD
jgi:fibulin 1/2